ncbi:MAG: hypothetical protein LAT78_09840 [Roseinatronobacter sp.]|nr:hypothetical protein [Roseinatronobacter sp.]
MALVGTSGDDLIVPRNLQAAGEDARAQCGSRVFDVVGGEGDDTIIAATFGDPTDDTRQLNGQDGLRIFGGDGNDVILSAVTGGNTVFGGAGDDTLVGANTALYGGDGDDVIFSGPFDDEDDRGFFQTIRAGAGNDTIHVLNGFADIRGGEGIDEVILTYDRPVLDENGNPDREFARFGGVVIKGFDPALDKGAIILPPPDTGNIELGRISLDNDNELRIRLRVDVPSNIPAEPDMIFRARVTVQDITSLDTVRVVDEADRRVIYFGQPDGFEPRAFDIELEKRVLDVHFPAGSQTR